MRNPHERLIKSLRDEAKGFDEAATRLQALFKQIVTVPAYGEAFRSNKLCAAWQESAKQGGGN